MRKERGKMRNEGGGKERVEGTELRTERSGMMRDEGTKKSCKALRLAGLGVYVVFVSYFTVMR